MNDNAWIKVGRKLQAFCHMPEDSLDKQRHVAMGLDHLGRILVVA